MSKPSVIEFDGADHFCGGGIFTTGFEEALKRYQHDFGIHFAVNRWIAVNHWDTAAATYKENHAYAEVYCQSIQSVRPEDAVPSRKLDILIASPECTHFSTARGGTPKNDQSRSLIWDTLNWATHVRIRWIVIENVPEFVTFGPLGVNGKPLKSKKGEGFKAVVAALQALNYKVEWRILKADEYGGATSRKRFFLQAKLPGAGPIVWPEQTHGTESEQNQLDLFNINRLKAKKTARNDVIDWNLPAGKSIFNCDPPLSPNTMRRCLTGFFEFGLKGFVMGQQSCVAPRSVDEQVPTIASAGVVRLAEPFILSVRGGEDAYTRSSSIDMQIPAITANNVQALVSAFLVQLNNHKDGVSLDDSMPTIVAGGGHFAKADPYIVGFGGPTWQGEPQSVDKSLGAVMTRNDRYVLEPYITSVMHGQGDTRARSVDDRLWTLTGAQDTILADPFLLSIDQTGWAGPSIHSIDGQLNTITGKNAQAVASPYLIEYHGTTGRERTLSLDKSLPTVDTSNRFLLCEPYLVKYYHTGIAHSIDQPVDTLTTKERYALAVPMLIGGQSGVIYVDIRFRMLEPHELARAMGIPDSYRFISAGFDPKKKRKGYISPMIARSTKKDAVRIIGNGVSREQVEAIFYTGLQNLRVASQN